MNAISPPSLDALMPSTPAVGRGGASRLGGQDFASMLAEPSAAELKNDEIKEAADQLVATAFILPLLEQARNDPFKSEMFHGGQGEDIFGQQLDVIFADNITKSANFGISDAMVRRFQTPAPGTKPAPGIDPTKVDLRG